MQSTAAIDTGQFSEVVQKLLAEASESGIDSREEERKPFFRPVTLILGEGKQQHVACFSRDISDTGIGLLHYMPLQPGSIVVMIPSILSGHIRIESELVWCHPCGDGWYISAARFLGIVESEAKPRHRA